MARVPFIDPDSRPDLADLVERIRGLRRGSVINVYCTLLHSPPLAESWFDHINRVRWGTGIDGRLREIVIIRIGHLGRSAYVLRQHVPVLAEPEGLSEADCHALAEWEGASAFDERERATLAYVDSVVRDIDVPDEVFEPLRAHFDDRQIVELTMMIGAYISHSRVLSALRVDLEENP